MIRYVVFIANISCLFYRRFIIARSLRYRGPQFGLGLCLKSISAFSARTVVFYTRFFPFVIDRLGYTYLEDLCDLSSYDLKIELAASLEGSQTVTILSQSAKLTFFGAQDSFNEAVFTMASIPVASFSAPKIHDHVKMKCGYFEESHDGTKEKIFRQNTFGIDKLLQNYNSKLMNSIWGQYNLYAAHAFQKNNEGSAAIERIFDVPQVKNLWNIRSAH